MAETVKKNGKADLLPPDTSRTQPVDGKGALLPPDTSAVLPISGSEEAPDETAAPQADTV
jgi:hypothetical protein